VYSLRMSEGLRASVFPAVRAPRALAARVNSLAAFDGRCILAGCVASPSSIPTNGNRVEGSHIGRRLQGAVSGTIDGDGVRLRSSLPHEGTQLAYRFDGRVQGQTIEGEVDLGEYGTARWTARRVG